MGAFDHEYARVSKLPEHSGDGYGWGGGAIVTIGSVSIMLGEGPHAHQLAAEIARRWRGPLLIHAAKGMTRDEYADCRDFAASLGLALPPMADLPRGGIVGRARLVDCVTRHASPWFFGRYGLVLAEVESIPFTPLKGALGLFDVPEGVLP